MRLVPRKAAVAAVAAVASLALAGITSANGVGSGKTKLKPDQDTFEALADMSISVDATGRAKWTDTGLKFPVAGGDFTPGEGGIIAHAGGMLWSRSTDGADVKFKRLEVFAKGKKLKLLAQVSGSEGSFIKLAKLDGNVAGTDTSVQIKNAKATLSKAGAEVLTETFDFPFRKGIPLGTTTTKAQLGGQVEE